MELSFFECVLFHTWTRASRRCILFVRGWHMVRVEAILLDVTQALFLSLPRTYTVGRVLHFHPLGQISLSLSHVGRLGTSNGGNIRVYWLLELGFQTVPFALPFFLFLFFFCTPTHTHTLFAHSAQFPLLLLDTSHFGHHESRKPNALCILFPSFSLRFFEMSLRYILDSKSGKKFVRVQNPITTDWLWAPRLFFGAKNTDMEFFFRGNLVIVSILRAQIVVGMASPYSFQVCARME